jgi:PAS domain S-box-containing protein
MYDETGAERAGVEGSARCKDGSSVTVELAYRTVPFGDGDSRVMVVRDLQERKRATKALRDSEERYRKLVETCPDGITLTDLEGNLLMTNPQAAAIHGFSSAEELVSHDGGAFDFIAPEDRQRAYENARKTLETGHINRIEYSVLTKDGARVPAELSASLITDEDGKPQAFIGVVRDISERKQAEDERDKLQAQIQHAQKLESLGVLAGGIAHDFNNLLVGILGNASLALSKLPGDDQLRPLVEHIERTALRARELTEQLLAYSGHGQFDVRPVDLSHLVQEMAELLSLTVSKKATLSCECADELPAVEGDATQLRQVVMNLITNASEALGNAPGTITVRTRLVQATDAELDTSYVREERAAGRYVSLEVIDDGCGMDADVTAKLFDPFFTTKFPGRGLGLSAVLGIVRGHRGTIQVDSASGKGTTIRVLLPAGDRPVPPAAPQPPARPAPPAQGRTILVVDDEAGVRQVVHAMLTSAEYQVVLAHDGREALERFREAATPIDAVILDATMPEMDGAETSRALRRLRPDVRILFSSGFTEQEVAERISLGESDGFIQKPYRLGDLLEVLGRVLAQPTAGASRAGDE